VSPEHNGLDEHMEEEARAEEAKAEATEEATGKATEEAMEAATEEKVEETRMWLEAQRGTFACVRRRGLPFGRRMTPRRR